MPRGVYVRTPKSAEAVAAKFWANVSKSDGCWEWTGLLNVHGYGRAVFSASDQTGAHRFAWTLANGPIPKGRVVMHSCDNRKCVNPAHLSMGTQRDNIRDASRKRRLPNQNKMVCKHGHRLTAENVYIRPRGGRSCLPCRRAYNAARKKRLRSAA